MVQLQRWWAWSMWKEEAPSWPGAAPGEAQGWEDTLASFLSFSVDLEKEAADQKELTKEKGARTAFSRGLSAAVSERQ